MYSLESPLRGDSNEYTLKCIDSWSYEKIFLGILERVRNSLSKRVIGVRVIEVSL